MEHSLRHPIQSVSLQEALASGADIKPVQATKQKRVGYVIFRSMFVEVFNADGELTEQFWTPFEPDTFNKKLYQSKSSADGAVLDMKKYYPSHKFEVHPVYLIETGY